MAGQIRRDQSRHGARNIEELIAGRIGSDGKRHWGWAPASDHNDTGAYIRNVSRKTGFGATQALNFNDPAILSALIEAIIGQENGTHPYCREQIRDVIRVEVDMRGAPPGTKTKVRSGKSVAISHAPVGGGR